MTGLRSWVRDPELPGRAGQPELRPLSEEELLTLLRAHVLLPDTDAPAEVSWEYARWKPGVSMTCTYRLHWGEDDEQLLVAKRYADDKATHLADRKDKTDELQRFSPHLLPRVVLPEQSLALWCPAADRELPGVGYLLDKKRFASLVKNADIAAPGLVRKRRSEYELLRYKAERRAVFRARLKLRDEARTRITLAARVLAPPEVQRIAAARTALEERVAAAGEELFVPRLRGVHERHGILLEEWLDVPAPPESADFTLAGEAGATLARLHRLPLPAGDAVAPICSTAGADLVPLFRIRPELSAAYDGLHEPAASTTTWLHGDFHPDQCARTGAGADVLLDLDELGRGDPARDLASWIADHLYEDPARTFDAAAQPLLDGYAAGGGPHVDRGHLARVVADELVCRGAAAIRRLEKDAADRAMRCLAAAQAIAPRG